MATTNTELYHRFGGQLRVRFLRFAPLTLAGIRTTAKKKIPLILLFTPPLIGTVIFSFLVYARYAPEAILPELGANQTMAEQISNRLAENLGVKRQIVEFTRVLRVFTILAIAWFGSGLFAEDRQCGAHQLYFARPITRLDYFLGKFFTAAFYGAGTVLIPGLAICLVAVLSSPNWSFLTDEWDVILKTALYAICWIGVVTLVVLCASSLVKRRAFALIGVFSFFMFPMFLATLLGSITRNSQFFALSTLINSRRIGYWLFDLASPQPRPMLSYDLWLAFLETGTVVTLCVAIMAFQIRRMEVVS